MKIGILTQPLLYNYGGILQAYALQTYLGRLGHEVWIIDRNIPQEPPFWRIPLGIVKRIILKYVFRRPVVVSNRRRREQLEMASRHTLDFIVRHIRKTDSVYRTKELKRLVAKMQFEALIVGSDQVWRPCYSPCLGNYFLDFLPADSPVKRIAYAASFGVDYCEFTEKQLITYKVLLERFQILSVRESSGVELCREYLNANALWMPDPTLLLPTEDYLNLLDGYPVRESSGCLFTYFLDNSADKQKVTGQVADSFGLEVKEIHILAEDFSLSVREREVPPVTEWLCGFRDAEFVVTDSFHGCVFSILFNKPFFAYGNDVRGMARFRSLLSMFGLEDRLLASSEELTGEKLHLPVCWENVNRILDEKRKEAKKFLMDSL